MNRFSKTLICAGMAAIMALTGCGGKGDIDLKENAKSVNELSIPEGVRIVGLGEAAHGNKEFQELKLEVFKLLVENYGVRAFCLEGDEGNYKKVDAYIKGEDVTLDEAMEALTFTIYKTNESKDLLEWMKEYNASHDDKVSFYGIDMQSVEGNVEFVCNAFKSYPSLNKFNADEFEKAFTPGPDASLDTMGSLIVDARKEMENESEGIIEDVSKETYNEILHALRVLEQHTILEDAYKNNPGEYSNVRDNFMAENVEWLLKKEESLGRSMIFVTGHNGHIGKVSESSFVQKETLGSHLKDEFGDAYYAIGTDYYHAKANIASQSSGKRGNHSFTSGDPLAKLSKNYPDKMYMLQFNEIDENDEVWNVINAPMTMGSLGEGYSFLMHIMKNTVRLNIIPTQKYDAMIFIYNTTPLDLIEK